MISRTPSRWFQRTGALRWRTLAVGAVALAALSTPALACGATERNSGSAAAPGDSVQHVAPAAVAAARSYWNTTNLATANPLETASGAIPPRPRAATEGPPPGTPNGTLFNGVPTVGALFFTTGTQRHFCTASAVTSLTRNLILTAAHCVYSSSYATNVAYVPEYHDGQEPFGEWPVTSLAVTASWKSSHDPNADYAFLTVAPPTGATRQLQDTTGALWLAGDTGYNHPIYVIGYNDSDNEALGCATTSSEFEPHQMQFNCNGYWSGTSGGPWITNFDPRTGSGALIGDIGGYETGGDYAWTSYSPTYDQNTLALYAQAEAAQLPSGG